MICKLLFVIAAFCFSLAHAAEPAVSVFSSSQEAAEAAAWKIANLVAEKKRVVLGLATGSTMIPVYTALKKIAAERGLDFSEVIAFNLDEYLNLPCSDPQSYHSFMFQHLYDGMNFKAENIYIPKGTGLAEKNASEYENLIAQFGPIDLQILGIGRNGHIGFSEPGTSFDSRTHWVDLTETTRKDNGRFFEGRMEQVPQKAITMGIGTILEAKEILLLAYGEEKGEIVAKTLKDPISEKIPATALRLHPKTSFFLDEKAASSLKNPSVVRFYNARVLIDHHLVEGELWVSAGKIISPQAQADSEIDVEGKIISPGFVDLQINGGFGCDFSRNPEKIDLVAKQLLQYGVTSFLPTVISSAPEQYQAVLPWLQPKTFAKEGAAVLGIHLEGPFFAPSCAGAHSKELLCSDLTHLSSLECVYSNLKGVKLVTLAPELPGALPAIDYLKKQNILVSAGHSAATFDQMKEGLRAGVGFATHLFNAMTPYHHRNPGIIGTALIQPSIPYSLIVDGIHLSPEAVQLCWRCNPEGLVLISDATEALGLPNGTYRLGTLEIESKEGQIYLSGTNTIAGSSLDLGKAVRIFRSMTGCSIADALEAASLKPAKLIQAYPSKGTLEIGADADFLILDDDLYLESTYMGGELAWKR